MTLAQSDLGIKISWTLGENSTNRLIIYRSTSKYSKYERIIDLDISNKSFMDSFVKSRGTYFYKIQVYNDIDGVKIYSGYTEPVSIKMK